MTRVNKKKTKTPFEVYFDFLTYPQKTAFKKSVMQSIDCTQSSFYRKMKNQTPMRPIEKEAVAKAANMPVHFLFPETLQTA